MNRLTGRPPETVDTDVFLIIWEKFDSLDEIYEEVKRRCLESGRRPLSRASLAAKASNLRAKGVELSVKKRGPNPLDVARANELIRSIRQGNHV